MKNYIHNLEILKITTEQYLTLLKLCKIDSKDIIATLMGAAITLARSQNWSEEDQIKYYKLLSNKIKD